MALSQMSKGWRWVKLEIEALRNWNEVIPYRATWDSILAENNCDIVFMTFDWLHLWWKYHGQGNRLLFLIAKEGNRILGFCPLMEVPARGYDEIRFIGGDETSYMGFTIKNGYKCIVIESILDYLMDLKGNYIINIHGIFKDTDEFSIIKNYMDKAQRNYIEPSLKCYFLVLNSKDYNDYVATRFRRSSIRTMQRKERRLARLGELSFRPFAGRESDIDRVFEIHDKRWQRKIGSSKFSKGKTREFFKELAMSDKLLFDTSVDVIELSGSLISFIYGFTYKDRYTFYRIGHDDYFAMFSPGELVLRYKIKDCFEKGYKVFDFGVGHEPYKAAWTDDETDVISFIFSNDGMLARLIFKFRRLTWSLRQFLKKQPGIYNFVKYRLGKFKLLLYPGNARKALSRGHGWLKSKTIGLITHIYSRYDYHILYKRLKNQDEADYGAYTTEEAFVDRLELLTDIMKVEPREVLRRFLDGDRCILVCDGKFIHCYWIDIFSIKIPELNFNWKMNKDSAFIYEHHTNHKGSRISQGSLNSVLSYLKGLGNRRCYLAIKSRNAYLMGLAKNTGFNKFQRLRLTKWLGRLSFNELKGITR